MFYYDEVNTNVNSIQSVILFILSLRNNQENDYIGTKTPHFITLKASADCGIQPTLDLDTAPCSRVVSGSAEVRGHRSLHSPLVAFSEYCENDIQIRALTHQVSSVVSLSDPLSVLLSPPHCEPQSRISGLLPGQLSPPGVCGQWWPHRCRWRV